jgi:hypothetical protein
MRLREFYRGYPEHIVVNGHKVRRTGPCSVDRDDAFRANWDSMARIARPLVRLRGRTLSTRVLTRGHSGSISPKESAS